MSSCQNKFWRSFIVFLCDSFHRNSEKRRETTTNRKLVSCLSKEETPSDLGKIEFYCVFREICKIEECLLNGNFVVKYLIAND